MGYTDPATFGAFIEQLGGRAKRTNPDGSIEVELRSFALRPARHVGEPAFISSLCLAGSPGFESMRVALEDGEAIPARVIRDVRAALDDWCELIRWRPGDIAMLDNTRFLHGRRSFSDPRRRMYLVQTLRANI